MHPNEMITMASQIMDKLNETAFRIEYLLMKTYCNRAFLIFMS